MAKYEHKRCERTSGAHLTIKLRKREAMRSLSSKTSEGHANMYLKCTSSLWRGCLLRAPPAFTEAHGHVLPRCAKENTGPVRVLAQVRKTTKTAARANERNYKGEVKKNPDRQYWKATVAANAKTNNTRRRSPPIYSRKRQFLSQNGDGTQGGYSTTTLRVPLPLRYLGGPETE